MKTGGIIIMIAGITLVIWHLFRGEWDQTYRFGYASHQVMSVDGFILVLFGAVIYFWGGRRYQRGKTQSEPDGH